MDKDDPDPLWSLITVCLAIIHDHGKGMQMSLCYRVGAYLQTLWFFFSDEAHVSENSFGSELRLCQAFKLLQNVSHGVGDQAMTLTCSVTDKKKSAVLVKQMNRVCHMANRVTPNCKVFIGPSQVTASLRPIPGSEITTEQLQSS